MQIAIELYNVINNIRNVDTQLVLVHTHHCLLVQQFNIQLQLQHYANHLLPVYRQARYLQFNSQHYFAIQIVNFDHCQFKLHHNFSSYQLQLFININFNFISTSTLISTSISLSTSTQRQCQMDIWLQWLSNGYLNQFTGTREFFQILV